VFSSDSNKKPGTPGAAPIKIGLVTSLSDIGSIGGRDMVTAMNIFLEEANHEIAGRKVELIVEDDQYSLAVAMDKVNKLVKHDGVQVLIGTIPSHIAYGIAPLIDSLGIPMILPISGADDLTKRTRYNWVIRTSFSSSQLGHPFAEWVYNKLKYSRIATFGLDFALGWEIVGSFQKTFQELGGKVVQKLWASQSLDDYSNSMRQLVHTADAIFFATSNRGADIVAKAYSEFGPKLPIIGGGPGFDETVLRDTGNLVLGAISVSNYSGALKTAGNLHLVEACRRRQASVSVFLEHTYTGALWLQKAIEAIDGNVEDRSKLLQALKSVELLNAPRGPMKLDQFGNPIQNIYIRKVEKVKGDFQNTVIDTFPNVSQFWTYDPETYMKQPTYSRNHPPA
jgi:branched-chain amino acid transport system substrate-binding protein